MRESGRSTNPPTIATGRNATTAMTVANSEKSGTQKKSNI
ncbi:hypothetical protein CNE_1c28300 [Cupriavidus necator N-1]|uniref:Uncharacterized protein n=1 Tax=Cupriavidus necator (strain ATCC 43291 / DSM 13513 / CCUG 52238 / LMG 8453 / N-1) TaxID=1042878 RepID=G0ETU4_CUPNN|nr:hypothetical protein CNE_1c28300 [Cupriavidus necator N-1]